MAQRKRAPRGRMEARGASAVAIMTSCRLNIENLILRIHATPLAPETWRGVIEAISNELGACSALMLRINTGPGAHPWLLPVNYDLEAVPPYTEHWVKHDAWLAGAESSGRVRTGMVSVDDQLVLRSEFLSSGFFQDYLKVYGLDRMMNVCLSEPSAIHHSSAAALSFFRRLGAEEFSSADVSMLSALSPHLVLASNNAWRVAQLCRTDTFRAAALDSLSLPMFTIEQDGRLIFANRAAETVFQKGQHLTAAHGRVSAAADLHERQVIDHVLRQMREGLGTSVVLTGKHSQWVLTSAPLSPSTAVSWMGLRMPSALLWMTPLEGRLTAGGPMTHVFGLTGAEQRLLEKLLNGSDVRRAAEALNVSIHTARTQLKSMLAKTGRKSQGQLLTLATRMATVAAPDRLTAEPLSYASARASTA